MRRGSLGLAVAVATGLALALPAGAMAGHHHQPCTSSAVCQYLEHIPGAGGDRSTAPGGGGHSPISSNALESHGAIGPKTLALANATAPAGLPHLDGGTGGGDGGSQDAGNSGSGQTSDHGALVGAGGGPDATGGAPEIGKALSHVLGTGGAGSGMGIVLPIIMLLSLVAALLLAVARRRGAIQS